MKENNLNTDRSYTVQQSVNGYVHTVTIYLLDFINGIFDDQDRHGTAKGSLPEFMYAIHSIFDQLLDLRPGESIYFQPNRDDKNSKGIITRK